MMVAFGVGRDDGLANLVEDVGLEAEPLLAPLAHRDVGRGPHDAVDRAVDDDRDRAHLVPADRAVAEVAAGLVKDGLARLDDLPELAEESLASASGTNSHILRPTTPRSAKLGATPVREEDRPEGSTTSTMSGEASTRARHSTPSRCVSSSALSAPTGDHA